ncbi:hypothetical protein SLA2020_331360 [Shorea laevis]
MLARNHEDELSSRAEDYIPKENRELASFVKEDALSKCCNSHPEQGKCLPNEDDIPPNGHCYLFCSSCPKGCLCKRFNDEHHECHCYC